jgi:hypothetical protein
LKSCTNVMVPAGAPLYRSSNFLSRLEVRSIPLAYFLLDSQFFRDVRVRDHHR